jgi:hypothetical protein
MYFWTMTQSGCVCTACSQLLRQLVWNKLLLSLWLMTVTDWHELVVITHETCWNNLLRVCWPYQPCYNLFQTCQQLGQQRQLQSAY